MLYRPILIPLLGNLFAALYGLILHGILRIGDIIYGGLFGRRAADVAQPLARRFRAVFFRPLGLCTARRRASEEYPAANAFPGFSPFPHAPSASVCGGFFFSVMRRPVFGRLYQWPDAVSHCAVHRLCVSVGASIAPMRKLGKNKGNGTTRNNRGPRG